MNGNTFSARGFLVWTICALFFLYEFFLRTVVGTYQYQIMEDLNLSSFHFSLLGTTIFLLTYGAMQIPAGLCADNIGLKKTLLIGTLICTLSSFGFASAYSYPVAAFYRLLMGFGASCGFICLLISVHDWMPSNYRGIFIGLSQLIGTLGPMAAAGPLAKLSESSGINWRFVFFCLGFIGILLAILTFFFVKNNQQKIEKYTILYKSEKILTSISKLFSRIQPWYIALFSAFSYFTVEYLSANEGRAFLALKGINIGTASYMITISWIGYALGCPLLGFLSDIFKRRKIVMIISSVLGLIAILIILYQSNKQLLQIGFFILGLGAAGQSVGFAIVGEQFKKQSIAVGLGLNNMMITAFSAIDAPILGFSLDFLRQGAFSSLNEYLIVFSELIVLAFIALILSVFFIKETFCKSAVDFTYLKVKKLALH